jgi:hypothetical protein
LKEATEASWSQEMVIEEMFRSFTRVNVLQRAISIAARSLDIADRISMTVEPQGDITLRDALTAQQANSSLALARHIETIAQRISIQDIVQKIIVVAKALGGPNPEDIANYIFVEGTRIAEDAVQAVMRERFKPLIQDFYREAESAMLDVNTTKQEMDGVIKSYRLVNRALHRAKQYLGIDEHLRELERSQPYRVMLDQRATKPFYLN